MAYNVLWSTDAVEDVNHFLTQFSIENNTTYAKGLMNAIAHLMGLLAKMPRLHPVWEEEVRAAPLLKLPYMLYYIVNEQEKQIIVIGLLHQKQDNSNISNRR
jgi:plasmid stabilization system protein ParE